MDLKQILLTWKNRNIDDIIEFGGGIFWKENEENEETKTSTKVSTKTSTKVSTKIEEKNRRRRRHHKPRRLNGGVGLKNILENSKKSQKIYKHK